MRECRECTATYVITKSEEKESLFLSTQIERCCFQCCNVQISETLNIIVRRLLSAQFCCHCRISFPLEMVSTFFRVLHTQTQRRSFFIILFFASLDSTSRLIFTEKKISRTRKGSSCSKVEPFSRRRLHDLTRRAGQRQEKFGASEIIQAYMQCLL